MATGVFSVRPAYRILQLRSIPYMCSLVMRIILAAWNTTLVNNLMSVLFTDAALWWTADDMPGDIVN